MKSRNRKTVGPAPTRGYINLLVNNPTHNLYKFLRRFGPLNAISPADTSSTSVGPSLLNAPEASITPGPPSTASLVSSGPSSALILSTDVAQVILQDQRNIAEMRFRLPARLSDGISLPHHQIQTPGSFALMPENRLHFILLFSLDHHGRWWLLPLLNSSDCLNLFKLLTWKTGWTRQAGGRSNP